MTDNVHDLPAQRFYSTSDTHCPEKAELQTRELSSVLESLSDVYFKVNMSKRKSEVLEQQKEVVKIDCLKCANMWSLWCGSTERGRPLLRPRCQEARLFHYTAQNNSRQPLR